MSTQRRAAIYARISQDAEGTEVGVSNQVDTCRALAAEQGLNVVAVYTDNDRGASSLSRKKRPQFDALLEAAERREFDVILAYSMSRLTRRASEWETLIALAQTHGIEYTYQVSPKYDLNTADGRGVARTVAAWDAAEAERTGERVKVAKLAALAQGKDIGGPRPFGWEPDRRHHRDAEAALIRSGTAAILGGESVKSVAHAWNASGVLPPRAGRPNRGDRVASPYWRPQAVRHILSNPRQTGRMIVKGVDYGRVAEPIISDEEHGALLAIFANPARKPKRGPEPMTSTAQQLVRCGACGGHMGVGHSRGNSFIRCGDTSYVPGSHPSVALHVAEDQLGTAALWALLDLQPEHLVDARPEVASLQIRIAESKARLERITAAYVAGIGDLDHLGRESATIKAEIAESQGRLDSLLASSDSSAAVLIAKQFVPVGWGTGEGLVDFTHENVDRWLTEYWRTIDVPARRRLLRGLFREIRTIPADRQDPSRFEYDGRRLLIGRRTPRPYEVGHLTADAF